jgi:hypothetical protein
MLDRRISYKEHLLLNTIGPINLNKEIKWH